MATRHSWVKTTPRTSTATNSAFLPSTDWHRCSYKAVTLHPHSPFPVLQSNWNPASWTLMLDKGHRHTTVLQQSFLQITWKVTMGVQNEDLYYRYLQFAVIMKAWKANKHIAQGNALGFYVWQQLSPWKGKSINCQRFCPFRATLILCFIPRAIALGWQLLAFQAVFFLTICKFCIQVISFWQTLIKKIETTTNQSP